jgi:hypothetical protein
MTIRDHAERATFMTHNQRPDEHHHATLATRDLFPFARHSPKSFSSRLCYKSGLTPGITRRPAPLRVDDKQRVGGRVHAVVRCGGRFHRANDCKCLLNS